ncbi:MAG: DNA repair protein RadC [Cytophagales bacterium]|nr:DNA repair protein RadC [Cytophagales bacterium]
MLLTDLPPDARPREKLLTRGADALADAELLALLLRTGMPGKNVLLLAQELLDEFGGITGLLSTAPDALKKIKGIGPAKRAELLAVLELARRALVERLADKPVFESVSAMQDYLRLRIGSLPYESFVVAFFDSQQRLIACDELFRGTLSMSSVYPREVVVRTLHHGAAAVVLAHNHPSGDVQPSEADKALTHNLRAALALIDVRVLDHIIVGKDQALSMLEVGAF